MAEVDFEPQTSRAGVWRSSTEPPRSPVHFFVVSLLLVGLPIYEPRHEKSVFFCICKNKDADQLRCVYPTRPFQYFIFKGLVESIRLIVVRNKKFISLLNSSPDWAMLIGDSSEATILLLRW